MPKFAGAMTSISKGSDVLLELDGHFLDSDLPLLLENGNVYRAQAKLFPEEPHEKYFQWSPSALFLLYKSEESAKLEIGVNSEKFTLSLQPSPGWRTVQVHRVQISESGTPTNIYFKASAPVTIDHIVIIGLRDISSKSWWERATNWVANTVSDVGEAVEEAAEAIADKAEELVDKVADTFTDIVDHAVTWVHENYGKLGAIANVLGGFFNGLVDGFRGLAHDFVEIFRDIGSLFGAALRLDFAAMVSGITHLAIDFIDLAIDGIRIAIGGNIVGGIVRQFEREELRQHVKDLLDDQFGYDPKLLQRIKDRIKIKGASWGLRLTGRHLVFVLDSENTQHWKWHENGFFDLYSLAGDLSFESFDMRRPRTWVEEVGEDSAGKGRASRATVSKYLNSNGEKKHLRVYAMNDQAVSERLDVATEKCRRIGVRLSWDEIATREIRTEKHYEFDTEEQETFVVTEGLRKGVRSEECILLALGAFRLIPGKRLGNTAGRNIREGKEAIPCDTSGRTDHCCVTILPSDSNKKGSSVIHRDEWPRYGFRYVLAHEIGHYLGLCHYGHDGVQNIMYTADKDEGLSPVSWSSLKYYYQSEPEFILEDGKNVWRFIVGQLPCCLDPELECGIPKIGALEGIVMDEEAAPLPGVRLSLSRKGPIKALYSDVEGRFSFSELVPGEYNLRVELDGFITADCPAIEIVSDQVTNQEIILSSTSGD